MRISNVISTLTALYANEVTRHRAVLMLGKSGIGKSAAGQQVAEAIGGEYIDMRLTIMEPSDFGIPVPDHETGQVKVMVDDRWPTDPNWKGIICLEEITSAVPAVQAAAYQVVLDRIVGNRKLPDGAMIIAGGNRADDRGVTYTMASPLINRFTVIEVDEHLEDFALYAASKNIRPEVLAFVHEGNGTYLHKFDKTHFGKQFPSPRSWFAVSDLLNCNLPPLTQTELVRGAVGEEAADAFNAYLKIYAAIPSITRILEDPSSVDVPRELSVQYCLTMGLSMRMNQDTFGNAVKFLNRMPKDMEALCVKLAYQRDPSIVLSLDFADWCTKDENKQLLAN